MNIGIEPKQYEFECLCGHIWIDCQNTGCPMCSEKDGIAVKQYEIPQPKNLSKK